MRGLGSIILAFIVSLVLAATFGAGVVLVVPGMSSPDFATQVGSIIGTALLACAALSAVPGALFAGGLLFFEARAPIRVVRSRFIRRRA